MASLNTTRRLNMQQYEIGITPLSQEAHTRESRSNTLALTVKAYTNLLLYLSPTLPHFALSLFRPAPLGICIVNS